MGIEFFQESEKCYSYVSDLIKDLNLQWIVRNMAHENYGDVSFIMDVIQRPLTNVAQIQERQEVVMAACKHPDLIVELRRCIVEISEMLDQSIKAIQDSRGKRLMEETVIGIHVEGLRGLVTGLGQLHQLLRNCRDMFLNTGLRHFALSFQEEESEEMLIEQQALTMNLDSFKDKGEIFLDAKIGKGFQLQDIEVISVSGKAKRVSGGLFSGRRGQVLNDEEVYQSGVDFTNQVLLELLNQCFPFMQRWQKLLQTMQRQVMFLAGCAKLYQRGMECGMYFCMPSQEKSQARKLYELALALQSLETPIHNTVDLTKYQGIVVTGANQGGKSTFLRSLGIAQVLCQAGMFVPAKAFPLRAYEDVFTHFTRREDATMNMGKFEEELKRMEEILRGAVNNTLILLNESFATTTEVTAFQIAMDLAHVCMEHGVTIWMVTHITKFAKELYREKRPEILFLSAGRQAEDEIRFMMYEKTPGDTSYGLELYEQMIEGTVEPSV